MLRQLMLILVAAPLCTTASADVDISLEILGYSDLFKSCEIGFDFAAPETIDVIHFTYSVEIEGKGGFECEMTSTAEGSKDSGCSPAQFDYTCEDSMVVHATGLGCSDGDGNEVDCGRVSLTAPREGLFVFE